MVARYGSIEQVEKDDEVAVDFEEHRWSAGRILKFAAAAAAAIVGLYQLAARFWFTTSPSVNYGKRSNPATPHDYRQQFIDHHDPNSISGTFKQRYYENLNYFQGPGSPIFAILGGKDKVEKILYPFVSEHLARDFGAYTICMEHRFYGTSIPVNNPTNQELQKLLTPDQAMLDFVELIRYQQERLGCGPRGSHTYCPVVTVGAAYPGFLSTLMRLGHPDVVDIGYASSAPLLLYSHRSDRLQSAYYDKVTQVAETASPGCAQSVRTTLWRGQEQILSRSKESIAKLASEMGICVETIPSYIQSHELLSQEVMMIIATRFAYSNRNFYPPSTSTELIQQCRIFQRENADWAEQISAFLAMHLGAEENCFDIMTELPLGRLATISGADWSGVGGGWSGWMWDFQSCTLVQECGVSNASMFPPRDWSLEWLTDHCQSRFGYTPNMGALDEEFRFADLSNSTHLLFTNGLQDGWSVLSILQNVSEKVLAVTMVNGAHHSDLTHEGPSENDTEDVEEALRRISAILGQWLTQVRRHSKLQ